MLLKNLIDIAGRRPQSAVALWGEMSQEKHSEIVQPVASPVVDRGPVTQTTVLASIKDVVDRQDNIPDASRAGSEYTHVSSLIDCCTREHILVRRHEVRAVKNWTGAHRLLFAFGRTAEHHVRTEFIKGVGKDRILGSWCNSVDNVSTEGLGGGLDSLYHWTYGELTLMDQELMVTGSPDLLFLDEEGRVIVIEIKSTTTLASEIDMAQGNHVLQSILYRDLLRRMDYAVSPYTLIFYVSKKFKWGSPYREFWIDATTPTHANMVEQAWRFARTIRDDNPRGPLPARVCADHRCTRAKACPVVTNCFSME